MQNQWVSCSPDMPFLHGRYNQAPPRRVGRRFFLRLRQAWQPSTSRQAPVGTAAESRTAAAAKTARKIRFHRVKVFMKAPFRQG